MRVPVRPIHAGMLVLLVTACGEDFAWDGASNEAWAGRCSGAGSRIAATWRRTEQLCG
jgi:hypothetical protein